MVEGLAKERSKLAGEIEATHERLKALVAGLEHIDATLRIVAPDMEVEAIRPKAFRPPDDWSNRGEMSRICLSILRTAREPLTTKEVAVQLIMERGMAADTALLRLMTRRVASALRIQRDKGRLVSTQGPGTYQLWEIRR